MSGAKKIYLVKLVNDGPHPNLEGYRGNREHLFDCLAYEEVDGEHVFLHGFHSDTIPTEEVESIREMTWDEAMKL